MVKSMLELLDRKFVTCFICVQIFTSNSKPSERRAKLRRVLIATKCLLRVTCTNLSLFFVKK